jgi:hypothetical protein
MLAIYVEERRRGEGLHLISLLSNILGERRS